MVMSNLIEIKGLYYTPVFDGVDAKLNAGEKIAIIGPLGSGKSLLMKLMLGLERPERGKVYIFGKDSESLKQQEIYRLRQGIGVVSEKAALISNLKVVENVMLPLQYHTYLRKQEIMERAVSLLRYVGYRGDMWELPGPLIVYTKKSVAMARAMALDPAMMIYDGLVEGLDSIQGQQLLKFADEFHRQNAKDRLSIMMVNDENDLMGMPVDRILRIENRRIVQQQ
jgi:phospholipid/cholesterol/gamma-HCH transport system ATP-binding protein